MPLIVTSDPDMRTLPARLALFKGEHVTNYGLLMAGSVLALLPMMVAFLFVQRRFVEGIATKSKREARRCHKRQLANIIIRHMWADTARLSKPATRALAMAT